MYYCWWSTWLITFPCTTAKSFGSFPGLWNCLYHSSILVWGFAENKKSIALLQWRHNEHNGVSNHHPQDCLLIFLKKTSKLRVTVLCEGNSPVTGEFPAQRASYAENVSIWWRHHVSQGVCDHIHTNMSHLNRYRFLFFNHGKKPIYPG